MRNSALEDLRLHLPPEAQSWSIRYDTVVPHRFIPGKYQYIDCLVYAGGNIYAVDTIDAEGSFFFAPRVSGGIEPDFMYEVAGAATAPMGVADLWCARQEADGGTSFTKHGNDPLRAVKNAAVRMKGFLAERFEPNFQRIYFYPVVAFSRNADITRIRAVADGFIHTDELGDYIADKTRSRCYATKPSIQAAFARIPTRDTLHTAC